MRIRLSSSAALGPWLGFLWSLARGQTTTFSVSLRAPFTDLMCPVEHKHARETIQTSQLPAPFGSLQFDWFMDIRMISLSSVH
jgi:hypothetical protein